MAGVHDPPPAAGQPPARRLFYANPGFFTERRLGRVLGLMGYRLVPALPGRRPGPGDGVAIWGRAPSARRGQALAKAWGLPVVCIEDAFLRSLHPGRRAGPGLGFFVDDTGGVHFDAAAPSALERLMASHPLDDGALLARAREGIARLQALHLSKYSAFPHPAPLPPAGYVLVIDQARGDASIAQGPGAGAARFAEMLALAQVENPGARVLIKAHPEALAGLRPGHYGPGDAGGRVAFHDQPVSPWALLQGAVAVYTVSSQMGYEAILAGHRPVVLGQPFYAGWGLPDDRAPPPRRGRALTRAQVFAASHILAPIWYDPCRDRLCRFEEAVDQIEAETRAWRQDRLGQVALGMRLWKRPHLQAFFGGTKPLVFAQTPAQAKARAAASGRGLIAWGMAAADLPGAAAVEDGFLRSRGLGAALTPALSLICDDLGIYYDPGRESRLERLILAPPPPGGLARAQALRARIVALGLGKYNLGALAPLPPAAAPGRRRILVPGQVEDDASIRLGAGEIRTNFALLQAVRAAHPGAFIAYKPHPDVEAGLRPGALAPADLAGLADAVWAQTDAAAAIAAVDEVWTLTSTLGLEALLREKPVTTLGAPFYAGWGLTRDLGPVPERRRHAPDGHPLPRPSLDQLVHAALIAYPRYWDPLSRRPCPVEVVLDRLSMGPPPPQGPGLRLLAKLQGALASHAWLWRG